MSSNTSSTKVDIPRWDGTRESYSTYSFKINALCSVLKCSDALNPTKMANCPTQSEYDLLDQTSTDPAVTNRIKIWKANDILAGYFSLGQDGTTGVDAIKETMNDEYPMGRPYLALEKLNRIYKPKDVTSKIIMKTEVEAVTFKQADDYRTDVNHVMSKYEHKLSDSELLEVMVGKTGNTTFIKEINDELKKVNPSFESCCIEIAALQRLAKVKTGPVQQPKQKEVSLSNQGTSSGGGGGSKSKCSHCGEAHKRSDCKKLKEALAKQGDCKWCGKKGHLSDSCFTKYPDKKPKWLKLKGSKTSEASASNLEVTLASVQDFH